MQTAMICVATGEHLLPCPRRAAKLPLEQVFPA